MTLNAKKTSNIYNDKKIIWQTNKLNALRDNITTSPICVRIKPFNKCCHTCSWCAYNSSNTNFDFETINMHNTVKQENMLSRDKLLEILTDIKDMGVKCITYSGGGEPLMHPNIEEIFKITKNYKIGLSIITNGQLLIDSRARELYSADWVRVSMDYCDAEMFCKSRGLSEKKYQAILNNITNFSSKKKSTCDLTINYIITKKNYHKVYEAAVLLRELGVDNVRFCPVWTVNYFEYHQSIQNEVLSQLDQAKKLETNSYKVYHNYKIKKDASIRTYHKCFIQQIIPAIGADYNVYNCHNKAYTTDGIIGNIKNQSFKQMWNSKETKEHFENFNAEMCCKCQCANDSKNVLIHELISSYGDDYV